MKYVRIQVASPDEISTSALTDRLWLLLEKELSEGSCEVLTCENPLSSNLQKTLQWLVQSRDEVALEEALLIFATVFDEYGIDDWEEVRLFPELLIEEGFGLEEQIDYPEEALSQWWEDEAFDIWGDLDEEAISVKAEELLTFHEFDSLERLMRQTLEQGEYKLVEQTVSRWLQDSPEDGQAWILKGLCQEKTGDYEQAARCYSRALADSQLRSPEALIGLARLAEKEREMELASGLLAQAQELYQDDRVHCAMALFLARQGEWQLCEMTLGQLVGSLDGSTYEELLKKVAHYAFFQESWEQVLAFVEYSTLGSNHQLYGMLSEAYLGLGDKRSALECWKGLDLLELEELDFCRYLKVLKETGEYSKALELAREYHQEHPSQDVLEMLVVLEGRNSQWDKMGDSLEMLAAYDPESSSLALQKGWYLENQGEFQEAEKMYKRTIYLAPQESMAYLNLAWLYLGQGKGAMAQVLFESVLEKFSKDFSSMEQCALALMELDSYEKANQAWGFASDLKELDEQQRVLWLVVKHKMGTQGVELLTWLQHYWPLSQELSLGSWELVEDFEMEESFIELGFTPVRLTQEGGLKTSSALGEIDWAHLEAERRGGEKSSQESQSG